MKFKSVALAALGLLAAQTCALAGSTVNPNVPAANSPLTSAPVRQNFTASFNDINALQSRSAANSLPGNLAPFQDWANTTGCPTACLITIYDGTQAVTYGTLNQSTHIFTGFMGPGSVVGTAPITSNISGGIATIGINNGTSVGNPGTGVLEALLPIQTVTGTNKSFLTADLFKETRRSNSGSAMADTFPAAGATGLVNGTRITVTNVDASANDTITAGSGTTMSGTGIVGPGRAVQFVYDLANTTWRPSLNTASALLATPAIAHQWINAVVNGLAVQTQPGFADLSGSLAPSQCPAGTTAAIGCLEGDGATLSISSGIIGINLGHANTYTAAQTFPNNSLTLAELPTIGAATVIGSVAGGTPAALNQPQLTALINQATASLPGAMPAWPNNTTTFLRGDDTFATLNFAAIGGVATGAQLPVPGASSLGGVFSKTCTSGQFLQTINTDGTANCVTPAGGGNVLTTGTPAANQIPQFTSSTVVQGVNLASLLTAPASSDLTITGTTSLSISQNFDSAIIAGNSSLSTTIALNTMMGWGSAGGGACHITPKYSGRVFYIITGSMSETGGGSLALIAHWGTGTAPNNGAASTGTAVGGTASVNGSGSTGVSAPFTLGGVISTGSTGTAIWIDGFVSSASSPALSAVSCSMHEIL